MKVQPMGHSQDVVQQLGLQLISKAARVEHEITSFNTATGEVHRLDDAVFIGGKLAKLTPDEFAETKEINSMTVRLE